MSTSPTPISPSQTVLTTLMNNIAVDQQNLAGASILITNDTNAVATNLTVVTAATAALTSANAGYTTAQGQLVTDMASLLPDALQLQSDANALVAYLQANAVPNQNQQLVVAAAVKKL